MRDNDPRSHRGLEALACELCQPDHSRLNRPLEMKKNPTGRTLLDSFSFVNELKSVYSRLGAYPDWNSVHLTGLRVP